MAVDNPSYFSILGKEKDQKGRGRFSLLRRQMAKMGNHSSLSSRSTTELPTVSGHQERYSTPPSTLKRHSHRVESPLQTQMLVKGMPRARDIAPETRSAMSTSDLALPARYYNIDTDCHQTLNKNRRRHSIGAYFMQRSGFSVLANSSSQEELHFARKAHRIADKSMRGVMEDIIIISSQKSQVAEMWVAYLKACFEQVRKNKNKPPYRILNIGVEDIPDLVSPVLENKLKIARLEVLIICPTLLDYVVQYPQKTRRLASLLRQGCVLAMLLGVDEAQITEQHRASLVSFSQWRKMESVKDRDEKFVSDFLSEAIDILARNSGPPKSSGSGEKCPFTVIPKKVHKNQRKVVIVLDEPYEKEDVIQVGLLRNQEELQIEAVKKRNPYTLALLIPERCFVTTGLVNVTVTRNGRLLGSKQVKCESQLTALEQILRHSDDPFEFTCQALNILPTEREKLDDYFVKAFQKNVPPNFNLLHGSGLHYPHGNQSSSEEYPTLLHFAAKFGLEQLCWTLIESPGGEMACELRNCNDSTPSELAEKAGHIRLSTQLAGYMQMSQLTSAYSFLKGMIDGNQESTSPIEEYLNPRPIAETYQIPPSPRPCQVEKLATPTPPIDYMPMRPIREWNEKPMGATNHNNHNKTIDVEDELIEIINDFKNNVFSITEVEALVQQWRNRNDVKQSFREKQEQLNELRNEYERVQQKMREEMKTVGRPSPFERLRNFFRGKSKEKKRKSKEKTRPASSLSTISSTSSSSGRLSSDSSGESLLTCDSDLEKRFFETNSFKLANYDVPPTPIQVYPVPSPPSNIYYCNMPTAMDSRLHSVEEANETNKTDSESNGTNYVNLGDFQQAEACTYLPVNLPEYVNVESNEVQTRC